MSKINGTLISIEGIDGSGKSSLANGLKQHLQEALAPRNVVATKEPGDSELGRQLRVLLHEQKKHICDKAEFLLFAADRSQHFEELIIPALERGDVIVSDRMADSSLAYQGYGRGLDKEMIKQINHWAMKGIEPDIIFYLKVDFRIALPRIMERGKALTSFEQEEEQFFQRVSDGFEEIFKNRSNVIVLDGTLSIEELRKQATEKALEYIT